MDIGTGTPTAEEQAALPHHLIDVVAPDERYHAARFRAEALRAIDQIRARGRLPVLVGGTGLYVRALLKGLHAAPPADPALRGDLEAYADSRGPAALHARLAAVDPDAARRVHPNDRVRIVRAIEIATLGTAAPEAGAPSAADWSRGAAGWRLVMVGLAQERPALNRRLADRARAMVERGMMEEVRRLLDAGYHEGLPSMGGIGYRQFCAVLGGRMPREQALRLMIRDTTRYAKRQMTWFARDPEVRWIDVDRAGGVEAAAEIILKQVTQEGLIE
jgi:tRNA dimethylallyltransferase